MKLLPDGPELPPELLNAQEKGEVLFICGAGVSARAGLPSFKGLVEKVYEAFNESWMNHPAENEIMRCGGVLAGQYDRALGAFERRMTETTSSRQAEIQRARLRDAVRKALQPGEDANLDAHAALLALSRDGESNIRLATTNFDTLFERAWKAEKGKQIPSHAGAAMPQPSVAGCKGVLHLHGRLADAELQSPETDLVLTSPEFGEAYLRLGWASRYVYDLVRAYTVVLVGYQAEDPPMRYLLEALDADRRRYPDLRPVYAFASEEDDKALTEALWLSKGVTPIFYEKQDNHAQLYQTIFAWRDYAVNPAAWRKKELDQLAKTPPGKETARRMAQLLDRDDASTLLANCSPPAGWLSELREQGVFERENATPALWIAKRLDDPHMIHAAAGHQPLDDRALKIIERALYEKRAAMSAVRVRAWEILLSARKERERRNISIEWSLIEPRLRAGKIDYEARRFIVDGLRPRLRVRPQFRVARSEMIFPDNETISSYLEIDSEIPDDSLSTDIERVLNCEEPRSLVFLLQALELSLREALEHAEYVGYISDFDWSDYKISSVARHPQDSLRSGFYPIIRIMADYWERLAKIAPDEALKISRSWPQAPFILFKRLAIFAATNPVHPIADLKDAIMRLDDRGFWLSGAQVEIMRGLVARWEAFSPPSRKAIRERINAGIPWEEFPNVTLDVHDSRAISELAVLRRLCQLDTAGKELAADSRKLIKRYSKRHPDYNPSTDDRDAFLSWSETFHGVQGDSQRLDEIPDGILLNEAFRIQREQPFDQGDIWRKLCVVDPDRALRALLAADVEFDLLAEGWRQFFWEYVEDAARDLVVSKSILSWSENLLSQRCDQVAHWLRRQFKLLKDEASERLDPLWSVWDRTAGLVYADNTISALSLETLLESMDQNAGADLAEALMERLRAARPARNVGLGEMESRFTLVARAGGHAGLFGRAHFAFYLSDLHQCAPDWIVKEMLPLFEEGHAEALGMWVARAHRDWVGSAALFKKLKNALLAIIKRPELDKEDFSFEGKRLSGFVFSVLRWVQADPNLEYDLTTEEIHELLKGASPRLLGDFAWLLMRMQYFAETETGAPADKAVQWRERTGPLFKSIWPAEPRPDAEKVMKYLASMVMATGEAFPEAVEEVAGFLSPYKIYSVASMSSAQADGEAPLKRYPSDLLKLLDCLISPAFHPIPRDLDEFLNDCVRQDEMLASLAEFQRLQGYVRLNYAAGG